MTGNDESAPARARIRAAGPWDAHALAQLHITSWRQTYTGLLPAQAFQTHEAEAGGAWQRRLHDPGQASYWVAECDGDLLGFAWAEAVGPGQVRALELVGLYVLAEYHGTGVADDLLTCAVGVAPCYCWVARGNSRAHAFYRRHGFVADGAIEQVARWGGLTIERLVR